MPLPPTPAAPTEVSRQIRLRLYVDSVNERQLAGLIRSRFPGALEVNYVAAEREARIKFEGTYADLGRIEKVVSDSLNLAALVDPIRLVYAIAPANDRANPKSLAAALEGAAGVKKANVNGTSAEIFVEPGSDPRQIEEKAAALYKLRLQSHEAYEFVIDKSREGADRQALRSEALKLAGVVDLRAGVDQTLSVLALKGRVNRQALRALFRKHGVDVKDR